MLDNSTSFIPFSFGIVKKNTESGETSELILCSECKKEIIKAPPVTRNKKEEEIELSPPVTGYELATVADKPSPIKQAREIFLKNGPVATDHCLLQHFSRVFGVPIEDFRQELLQKVTKPIMDAKVFKGKVTVEGITYVIENGRLVTCYEKTKNKPKLKGKALKKAKERHQK